MRGIGQEMVAVAMQSFDNLNRRDDSELEMYHCGIQDCPPGHFFGPAVRDHFLIHYIRAGKGVFQVGGRVYRLERGQGFLICPGIVAYYQADLEDPWRYSWVGFHGARAEAHLQAAGLSAGSPIFSHVQDDSLADCIARMVESEPMPRGRDLRLKGLMYLFLSILAENARGESLPETGLSKQDQYVREAVEYIRTHYSRQITIAMLAGHLGLDRSYLCALFQAQLHVSPQEFLIAFRIGKACELMAGGLSIGDISRSVGYDDPYHFSRMFKKVKGLPPREFRRRIRTVGAL